MAAPATRPSNTGGTKSNQSATVIRLRFVAALPEGTKARREFTQPRRLFAVEESVPLAEFQFEKGWPEPTDHVCVVFIPKGAGGEVLQKAEAWLTPPDQPDAVPTITVERDDATIRWRPGQALVQGRAECRDDILAALADFAFYEGELRAMEQAVETREAQAQQDVPCTQTIRQRDRQHWKRFTETIEYFAQLRLTYARLEPRLYRISRSLPLESRRIIARLFARTDVEDRLEALNDRLEAMEDLYEGANDRVADFRWYRTGHMLEIGILVLLALEAMLMVGDMVVHYREYQIEAKTAETTALDLSDEFRATVTKVADGKVFFVRGATSPSTKLDKTSEQSLPIVENVKVGKGTIDRETREVVPGDALDGGLKNDVFTKLTDKGVRTTIVTDVTNKKIAEIYVLPATTTGRRGQ